MRQTLLIVAFLCASAVWAANAPMPTPGTPLTGTVLEVLDVEVYTYLRLKTATGETWAAVPKTTVGKGAEVTIEAPMTMNNFESKTLKRTFDKIVFGNLAGKGARPNAAAGMGDPAAAHAGLGKAAEGSDVKVTKATGSNARTVAEIVTGRAELKDKTILVRGKVVKYSPAIMGKNWVHLRDGTGSAAAQTNDVLVTTLDEVKVGEIVTVKGIVRTDRDLGSGYSYKVLVEEAKLQK